MSQRAESLNNQRWLVSSSEATDVSSKLLSFLDLEDGWHFGSGRAPGLKQIGAALGIARALRDAGAEHIEAFPEEEGGVLLIGYNEEDSIEVLCSASGTFDFLAEIGGNEVPRTEHLTREEAEQKIRGYAWRSTNSSVYFTLGITAEENPVTFGWPSAIQQAVAFPSLTQSAPALEPATYAGTLLISTPRKFPGIRLSSGDFHPGFFQEART